MDANATTTIKSTSGTPEYATVLPDSANTTMKYGSFWWLVVIFFILLLAIVVGVIWWGATSSSQAQVVIIDPKLNRNSPNLGLRVPGVIADIFNNNSNPGATSGSGEFPYMNNGSGITTLEECNSLPNRTWDEETSSCNCLPPFWGKECERESYSETYLALGTASVGELDVYKTTLVHRQSFPFSGYDEAIQTTCDQACDESEECIGYALERSDFSPDSQEPLMGCNLLRREPTLTSISFNPDTDSNVFLHRERSLGRPRFPEKVILYSGDLPTRFWLEQRASTEEYQIVTIGMNSIERIDFFPENEINDSRAILVFSQDHFTVPQGREMIRNFLNSAEGSLPSGWFVYVPGMNQLQPPMSWSAGKRDYWTAAYPRHYFAELRETSPQGQTPQGQGQQDQQTPQGQNQGQEMQDQQTPQNQGQQVQEEESAWCPGVVVDYDVINVDPNATVEADSCDIGFDTSIVESDDFSKSAPKSTIYRDNHGTSVSMPTSYSETRSVSFPDSYSTSSDPVSPSDTGIESCTFDSESSSVEVLSDSDDFPSSTSSETRPSQLQGLRSVSSLLESEFDN